LGFIKKACGVGTVLALLPLGACAGSDQLVGSNGSAAAGGAAAAASGGGGGDLGSSSDATSFVEQLVGDKASACLTFPLPEDDSGNPTCRVLSYHDEPGCDCTAAGLMPATADDVGAAKGYLTTNGVCGFTAAGQAPCKEACICTVVTATGDNLHQCQTQPQPGADATGWCYVSAGQGDAAHKLLESCTLNQSNEIRFMGDAAPVAGEIAMLACSGHIPATTSVQAKLGEPCVSDDEYFPSFTGYDANEINLDDHAPTCSTNLCLQNHFQGRASCPYGQAGGSTDCLVAGSKVPVSGAVQAQLAMRPTSVASICSCQCAGEGAGPYCTCPDSMQCEHLVDDLGLGNSELAGSYCIPKGSQYDPAGDLSVCTEPNCGDAHPY
jgi:hypothetical protein